MAPRDVPATTESLDAWLQSLLPPGGLGVQGRAVFQRLQTDPGHSSHAPATEIAELAGTSVSSVTRTAQKLGFPGWPRLQAELRSRYLARLSLVDIAASHADTRTPFSDALRSDQRALAASARSIDEAQIRRIARRITAAKNIHVTSQGSFAAVGLALAHNIGIAGYPVRELLSEPAALSNAVSRMGPADLLIVCSYWRIYEVAVIAAQLAHQRGASVVLLADSLPHALRSVVDEVVIAPAEGTSFFPSLTAATAVQQGIVATLASLDPARSRASMTAAESSWQDFNLLHHGPAPSGSGL